LLWRDEDGLEIQNFTIRHITTALKTPAGEIRWHLTCFYGHPISAKRHELWALLHHLQNFFPGAWMCVGNFNEIME
jgi:hypothetical protein